MHLLHVTLTPSLAATLIGLLFNFVVVVMLRLPSREEPLGQLAFKVLGLQVCFFLAIHESALL
jgi:hypothetical protein